MASRAAAAGEAARLAIRRGAWRGTTASLAPQCLQAHVVVLPASLAEDFRDFCDRNPQACPLLAVSQPGQCMLPTLGDDIDIRADLPAYQVWRDGELKASPDDIVSIWRRDLVTFVIAGSFGYEQRLDAVRDGLDPPGRRPVAPTYLSGVPTASVGPFGGPLQVTMRPMRADRLIRMIEAGVHLGEPHGLPVHLGEAALIGIDDLARPEQGEPRAPARDELPVFWASGVTALLAARRACPPLCITNAPGALLITDLPHRRLADRASDGPHGPHGHPSAAFPGAFLGASSGLSAVAPSAASLAASLMQTSSALSRAAPFLSAGPPPEAPLASLDIDWR